MEMHQFSLAPRLLWCSYLHGMTDWTKPNISAPFWRFYWNHTGGHHMYLDGSAWELRPERCFIIPANTPLAIRSCNPVNHFHIHFMLGTPYHAVAPAIHELAFDGDLRELIGKAIAIIDGKEQWGGGLGLVAHTIVCCALARVPTLAPAPSFESHRLRRVLAVCERSEMQAPNALLAGEAGLTTNAFIRWFRDCTGSSPQVFQMRKRIDRACELLLFANMSIEQIAEQTGFYDRHHFSKVFKRIRGHTPAAFRKTVAKV